MSFKRLKIHNLLIEQLESSGITRPSPIQSAIASKVMAHESLLISAPTGSGKTLAFLLPILTKLANQKSSSHHPRLLIFSPTKELATQLFEVANSYGRVFGFWSLLLEGGVPKQIQKKRLQKGADIIVATPQRFGELLRQEAFSVRSVAHVVIDEADMLYDLGFGKMVSEFMRLLPRTSQKIILSATITKYVEKMAKEHIPKVQKVLLSKASEVAPTVSHLLYPVLKSKKFTLLVELIAKYSQQKLLVFVR